MVGNSPDVNSNPACAGTYTRAADVSCGLSGRYVGIKASNQVLHICGIAVLEGNIGGPTGYWVPVASHGTETGTTFKRGVEMTDG